MRPTIIIVAKKNKKRCTSGSAWLHKKSCRVEWSALISKPISEGLCVSGRKTAGEKSGPKVINYFFMLD